MRSRRIAVVIIGFAVATAIVGCEIEVPLDDDWFPDASIPPPDASTSLPFDAPGSAGSGQDAGTGSGNGADGGVIPPPDAAI